MIVSYYYRKHLSGYISFCYSCIRRTICRQFYVQTLVYLISDRPDRYLFSIPYNGHLASKQS